MITSHATPRIEHDVPLYALNTFRASARAARFARVTSTADLLALHRAGEFATQPSLVLGGGSNVLFTKDYDGLVVYMALRGADCSRGDDAYWYPTFAAGENWDDCVATTLRLGQAGLENLVLIPGTVGAAPVQNIGAYGVELCDRFESLEVFCLETGSLVRMSKDQCEFSYRDSVFKRQHALSPNGMRRSLSAITSVTFRLPKAWQPILGYGEVAKAFADPATATATEIARVITAIRTAKLPDPAVIGNAGSFFKNPVIDDGRYAELKQHHPDLPGYQQVEGVKVAAAWLIEQCGWKGRTVGAVGVHEKQPLVLVNRGGATGAEILALGLAIAESVYERFQIALEIEPVVI